MGTNRPFTVAVPSDIWTQGFLTVIIPQPNIPNRNVTTYIDRAGNLEVVTDAGNLPRSVPAETVTHTDRVQSYEPRWQPVNPVVAVSDINNMEPGANSGNPGTANHRGLAPAVETIVDVNELVKSMERELENLHPSTNSLCIYKIPEQLRELNEKAYTPRLVSIGPFHHGKQNLKPMEDNKKIYLQEFLSKSSSRMEIIFEAIKQQETILRDCYAASVELDRVAFLKIMLVDGAFILNYLQKNHQKQWRRNDQVFNQQCLTNTIRFDILLLENQLPFFFLEHLLELFAGKSELQSYGVSLVKMVYSFLKESIGWNWLAEGHVDSSKFEGIQVKHLVHFLSICLQPSDSRRGKKLKIRTTPTISQLRSAGVKFESSSSKHFLDIEFKNGILQIPTWKIYDSTEILFRNLMAFEQLNHEGEHYLSDYAALMDMLIDDSKDVELLVRNGIIEHWLQDDEEVATLINGLGKYNIVREDEFLFADLIEDLNKYYKSPWHHYKATLDQEYFNNPWTVISVTAAGFLLLLTVVQTVCSILGVL